jgi:hypothetical protein
MRACAMKDSLGQTHAQRASPTWSTFSTKGVKWG